MNFDTPAAQAAVARRLSANTKAERDEALEAVKAWLVKNKAPTDFEYLKVWRALFYCFWMTDKRSPQLQVAQTLSCLLHELGDVSRTLRFARAFFATMVRDWLALDKHRIDKFYTLIRGMVRQLFVFLAEHEWDADTIVAALAMLQEEVFSQRPNGPRFHLLHIWLDELLVVDRGLPTDALVLALRPVWGALVDPQHPRLVELAMNDGVLKLLRQLVAPDDDSGEEEEEEASAGAVTPPPVQALPNVHGPSVGKLLFEIAADKRCDAEARDVLYMAHEGLVGEEEDPAAAVSAVQAGAGFSSSVDPVAQRLMVLAGLVDEAEEEVAAAAAAVSVPGQGEKKKAAGQRKGKKGGAVARAQGGDTAAQRRQGSGAQRGGGPSEEEAAAAAAGVAAASARYSKATSDRASAPTTRGSKRGRAEKGPPQGEEEEGDKRVRFTRSEALSHAASVKRLRRSARQGSAGVGESAMPKPVLKAGGSSSSPEEAEGGGVTGVAAWAVEDDDTDLVGNWGVPATTPPGKKGGAGKAKSPASSKKKRKKARRQ